MAFKSLPGDDVPAAHECKNFIDALLELGGVPGLYAHYDRKLYKGKLGIGLAVVLTKNVRVSEMYTTADRLREYSMKADLAVTRNRCAHIAYVADTGLRVDYSGITRHRRRCFIAERFWPIFAGKGTGRCAQPSGIKSGNHFCVERFVGAPTTGPTECVFFRM